MSYFSPDTAPAVHIELLPLSAIAVDASLDNTGSTPVLSITTWAPGETIEVAATSESSSEDFVEYTCCDCRYFTDEMEHEADGERVNGLTLTGTYYTDSPCSAYEDGLGSVSFPCENGHDGPSDSEDEEVSTENIRYTMQYRPSFDTLTLVSERIFIQAINLDEDNILVSDTHSAINCYDNGTVCWGDLEAPSNLADMLVLYTESPGNEDLTSIDSHKDGDILAQCNCDNERPTATFFTPYNHRGKAVVVVTAMWNTPAFLLFSASGCKVNNNVAYVPVTLYPNVAVDDDTILNVYATDVLSTNTRLLFYYTANNDEHYNGQLIGQVPSTFSLEPCTSQLPQSSEQAELASS